MISAEGLLVRRKRVVARLEVEPQLELDKPATGIVCARNRRIAVGSAGLAKCAVIPSDCPQRAVYAGDASDEEVRPVKRVQELNASFEVGPFGNRNALHNVKVKTRSHRTIENQAVA